MTSYAAAETPRAAHWYGQPSRRARAQRAPSGRNQLRHQRTSPLARPPRRVRAQAGRLTGLRTKGLAVAEHGPHVDKPKFPDAAFVELRVFLPVIGKSATITRKVSAAKKPKIVPADDDVKAALAEIAEHPEIT